MIGKDVANYTFAGVLDVLGVFGVPTATAGQIYQDVLSRRAKEAIDILLSEIRSGNFQNIDQNEAVSIIARYQRDAMEGVARNNLRLMARVINGMAEKNELKAPSFLRYASILSSLTDKEIRILAVMIQYKDYIHEPKTDDKRHAALHEVTMQAEGHLQALMRTGLINMKIHTIQDISDGTHKYALTKLMDEILFYIKDLSDFGGKNEHNA